MPPKTQKGRNRKGYAKYKKRARLGQPGRGLKQSVYLFKRSFTDTILLNDPSRGGTIAPEAHVGAYWVNINDRTDPSSPGGQTDGVMMRLQCKFNNLPNWTEFSNLFNQFKMTGIKVECIPQYTQSSAVVSSQRAQALAYIMPYNFTRERTAQNAIWEKVCLETQACKKRTIWKDDKSFSVYSKLKVPGPLVADEATAGTWVPSLSKSKWFGFDNASVACYHYGLNMRFQPINYSSFATTQNVKLIYTVYFACKGVC